MAAVGIRSDFLAGSVDVSCCSCWSQGPQSVSGGGGRLNRNRADALKCMNLHGVTGVTLRRRPRQAGWTRQAGIAAVARDLERLGCKGLWLGF